MKNFCTVVLAALLLGASPGASDGDARYAAFAQRWFAESFRRNPVDATAAGVHAGDARLGSYAAADWDARLAAERRALDEQSTIDPAALSPRARLDRAMLEGTLRAGLVHDATLAEWRHRPDIYVGIASAGVFTLIARPFAPAAVRLRDAVAREEAIPTLFAQARANLSAVDRESALLAADDADGTAALLERSAPAAFAGAGDAALRARFRRSTARGAAATRAFAAYLRARWVAHPRGTFAIGAASYRALLRDEEAVDLPLDAYLAIGRRDLARTRAAMIATARRVDPHASVRTVLARLYRHHPPSHALLGAAQADLLRLRVFVAAKHLVDLPPDASIRVTPTPEFMRATTVAAMDAPGPLERVARQAYYFVSPPDPHDPPRVQEQYLESFNDDERPIVSAHEVYPGHYTEFVLHKHMPLTLTEKLLGSEPTIEGWAHYGEQLIVDEGWGRGDPGVRLMQLREAIWRDARFVAGVMLHTRGWTVARAERFFREDAFLDPADARTEARRGTSDPLYGYYTLGKLEILKLRDDYRTKLGPAFTLARFHHDLLQFGNPPIPLLRPLLLGAADDGTIVPP